MISEISRKFSDFEWKSTSQYFESGSPEFKIKIYYVLMALALCLGSNIYVELVFYQKIKHSHNWL